MWSVGCMAYEIMLFIQSSDAKIFNKERYLFQGGSCFPMSPYKPKNSVDGDTPTIANNDQVKMILKCLGKQEEETHLSFVTSEYAMKYVKELQGTINHNLCPMLVSNVCHIQTLMSNPRYGEIVSSLLNFNPYFRMTAWECLKHPVFDSVRDK